MNYKMRHNGIENAIAGTQTDRFDGCAACGVRRHQRQISG
jgi:hypothetical protein